MRVKRLCDLQADFPLTLLQIKREAWFINCSAKNRFFSHSRHKMLFLSNLMLFAQGAGAFLPASQENPIPTHGATSASINSVENTACTGTPIQNNKTNPGGAGCLPFFTWADGIGIIWGNNDTNTVIEVIAFSDLYCNSRTAASVLCSSPDFRTDRNRRANAYDAFQQSKFTKSRERIFAVIFVHSDDCSTSVVNPC